MFVNRIMGKLSSRVAGKLEVGTAGRAKVRRWRHRTRSPSTAVSGAYLDRVIWLVLRQSDIWVVARIKRNTNGHPRHGCPTFPLRPWHDSFDAALLRKVRFSDVRSLDLRYHQHEIQPRVASAK